MSKRILPSDAGLMPEQLFLPNACRVSSAPSSSLYRLFTSMSSKKTEDHEHELHFPLPSCLYRGIVIAIFSSLPLSLFSVSAPLFMSRRGGTLGRARRKSTR